MLCLPPKAAVILSMSMHEPILRYSRDHRGYFQQLQVHDKALQAL